MEYVLYAACVLLYARSRPLRQLIRSVSLGQKIMVLVVLVGLFAGQIIRKSHETYPLASWGMYATPASRISYDEYVGVRADGTEFEIPICDLVRVRDQHLAWLLTAQAWEIEANGDVELRQLYEDTLWSAWRSYRRRNPGDSAAMIRVYSVKFPVSEYKGREAIQRRLRWEIRP
ncbi:MAG: hypothetical protein ACYTGZ_16190 [Planctomycetota bacterium]|jgi:hypothetical protein